MDEYPPTSKSTIHRLPARGHYDRATIYSILDAGMVCHVGFIDQGSPVVIPTLYGRSKDHLYLHGAVASRLLKYIEAGGEVSIAVTHVDGLVLARSIFEHSINYRSVVLFGKGRLLEDPNEKWEGLRIITEHILPGRWEDARQPDEKELNATAVVEIKIEEASAKTRTGGPKDFEKDLTLPVWAGVIPISQTLGTPEPDPGSMSVEIPTYLEAWRTGSR